MTEISRGRGGGGRGGRGNSVGSRKRRPSDDRAGTSDDESKRQKVDGNQGGGGGDGGEEVPIRHSGTQDHTGTRPTSDHPSTPCQIPDSELGAVGGVDHESF